MKKNRTVEMANDIISWDSPLRADTGNNEAGVICMANDSRFIEAYFSEPLTTYASGWKDPANLDALLEFIAPAVPTSRRFQFAKMTNAEEFIAESTEDVRAIGADFKRVEYTSSKADSSTQNKGLTIRVDMDQVADMPNWQQVYTGKLMRRLVRAEIRRAYALLVAAHAATTAKVWSDGATNKNPDLDVLDAAVRYGDIVGIHPSRVLWGLSAWTNRLAGYSAQATSAAFAALGKTPTQVAQGALCQEGYVSSERYTTALATKGKLVTAGTVVLFEAQAGQTPEDPSNIKRFVSNTEGGSRFRVFAQQVNAKLFDITVEHYSRIVITYTGGIQLITVT